MLAISKEEKKVEGQVASRKETTIATNKMLIGRQCARKDSIGGMITNSIETDIEIVSMMIMETVHTKNQNITGIMMRMSDLHGAGYWRYTEINESH